MKIQTAFFFPCLPPKRSTLIQGTQRAGGGEKARRGGGGVGLGSTLASKATRHRNTGTN